MVGLEKCMDKMMYGSCFRNSWYVAMDEWSSEKVVTNIMIEDKEG